MRGCRWSECTRRRPTCPAWWRSSRALARSRSCGEAVLWHVSFVWWVAGSDRLPPSVNDRIERADTGRVSDVSLWEIVVNEATKDPMVGIDDVHRWFVDAMSATGFEALHIDARHIGAVQRLPLHHPDPFDRLLIAQGLIESVVVVTADSQFPAYPIETCWGLTGMCWFRSPCS